ncbi:unnamed protein product [Linum tenue]|uniref:TIR domain-containing protein n=1 Tax=Linum tenue TaxID=586396 RepID=A0AAV0K9B2_9ROSI|nr:unnamed protein product [Linum tenue]
MGCIRICGKVILAPIVIPYKLCFRRKRPTPHSNNNIRPSLAPPPPPPFLSASTYSNLNDNTSQQHQQAPSFDSQQPSPTLPLPTADYEVFLSFRGPDTRHQFSEILGLFLAKNKIRTFLDDNELRQGDRIAPSLAKAIEQSKIYIPILSLKYAESKWCLNELAEMVEREKRNDGHIILPIFYLVEPRDVGHQTGPYEVAFQQHARKYDAKTILSWKNALQRVGKIKGWTVKSKDEHATIIDRVSSVVWSHINRSEDLLGADEFVGMDDHVEAVMEKLSLDSPGTIMVGLHGFGGIGKTTIARVVYHKLATRFERRCFLEDVRTTQEGKDGIISLQRKLISNIMITRDSDPGYVDDVHRGRKLIQDRVSQFKVLIILDDVDERFDFKEVLGDPRKFVSGSRFIVTSRNTKILRSLNENQCRLYEVRPMNRKLSLQLFCRSAFQGNAPLPGYETLSQEIVQRTEGVPLVLKVVGSSLLREEKSFWEDTLLRLGKIPHKEIIERLKISYESLDYEAKQVFLDIACFYIGRRKDFPSYMWSDLGFHPVTAITILTQRSLLKIGDDGDLQMHDQLRDMGRAIVREENIEQPWMRSRVWDKKEATELLQNMKGSNQVKALVVDDAYDNVGKLKRQHFLNLPKLRYFEAQQVEFIGDFINILPNIRWLCLPLHKSEGHHPINFPMENLIILDLNCSSNLQDDWGGWSQIKMAKKLKVMDLSDCPSLTKLPDFPESGSLEWLDLSNVNGLDSGVELDVGNLWNLKLLHLSNIKIGRITGGTIGTMESLQDLDLNDFECDNLKEVLVDIEELTSLERLQITRSEKVLLGKLPTSLKLLYTSYKVVNLWELLELEDLFVLDSNSELEIPPADEDSWWKVSKLKSMMLKKTKIEVVPTTSSCMLPSSLTSLLIWDCLESVWLPTLENLENLIHLAIKECSYLGEIQGLDNLLQFNKLETLELTSCPLLTSTFLRGSAGTAAGKIVIESLRELCIRKCGGGIPHLPSFPRLTTLEIGPLTPPDNDDQVNIYLYMNIQGYT